MENSFTIIYPNGKIEKKVEGMEPQETALTKANNKQLSQKRSLKHLLAALGHAMSWKQLKTQLTYPVLLQTAKKRWYIPTVAAAALFLFMMPRSEQALEAISENNGPFQQAAFVSMGNIAGNNQEKIVKETTTPVTAEPAKAEENPEAPEFKMPVIPAASRKEKSILKELGRHAKDLRDDYISRYAKIAKGEQEKYGIPASLSLGLAILQSDFGTNIVAKEGMNHLMIECDANPIPMGKGMSGQGVHGGVCYTRYSSVWMSFRAHSEMINRNYAAIKVQAGKDYKKWAKGLELAGYFREGYNASALIKTIETYNLKKFD